MPWGMGPGWGEGSLTFLILEQGGNQGGVRGQVRKILGHLILEQGGSSRLFIRLFVCMLFFLLGAVNLRQVGGGGGLTYSYFFLQGGGGGGRAKLYYLILTGGERCEPFPPNIFLFFIICG